MTVNPKYAESAISDFEAKGVGVCGLIQMLAAAGSLQVGLGFQ